MNEITEQAMSLLVRELGAADAARFLSQFTTGYGDYTLERKQLFEGLTMDEAVQAIKQSRE